MKHVVPTLFLALFSLFVGTAVRSAAPEVRFAASDVDGVASVGAVVSLNTERLVFQVDDDRRDISLNRLETLKNTAGNPYLAGEGPLRISPVSPNDNSPEPSRSAPERRFPIPVVRPEKSDSAKKTTSSPFPDSVSVVDLVDGSRLTAVSVSLKGKTARCLLLNDDETIEIPIRNIAAVRFDVPDRSSVDAPVAAWNRLATASDRKGDRLVVGQAGSLDVYDGVVLEISAETVVFSVDGDTLPVPRRRVAGLLFHVDPEARKSLSAEKSPGRLELWDGSRIRLSTLDVSENDDRLAWTALAGFSGRSALKTIDRLEFGQKDVLYLSDLVPGTLEQTMLFDWAKRPTIDSPTSNGPLDLLRIVRARRMRVGNPEEPDLRSSLEVSTLRPPTGGSRPSKISNRPLPGLEGIILDGLPYSKGLVVPCGTSMSFVLPEPFAALRGVAGFDDRRRPEGRARLVILADGELLCDWELRGDAAANPLKFELPGQTRMLTLTVDYLDAPAETPLSLGDLKLIK